MAFTCVFLHVSVFLSETECVGRNSGPRCAVRVSQGSSEWTRGAVSARVVGLHRPRCVFFSQVSEEPKVTQARLVWASEATWAPLESQVGRASGVSGGGGVPPERAAPGSSPARVPTAFRAGWGQRVPGNTEGLSAAWTLLTPFQTD